MNSTQSKSGGRFDAKIAKGNTWAIRRTLQAELNLNVQELNKRERRVKQTLTKLENVRKSVIKPETPSAGLLSPSQTSLKLGRRKSSVAASTRKSSLLKPSTIEFEIESPTKDKSVTECDTQTEHDDYEFSDKEATELTLETLAQVAINMADNELEHSKTLDRIQAQNETITEQAKALEQEYCKLMEELEVQKNKALDAMQERDDTKKELMGESAGRFVTSNILPKALMHIEDTRVEMIDQANDTDHMEDSNKVLLQFAEEISKDFLPWMYTRAHQKAQFNLLYEQLQDCIFAEDENIRENSKEYMISSL